MSYPPLKHVPQHPGPRPPWYRFCARRNWRLIMAARSRAKAHNFIYLYGGQPPECDERHTQTHDPVVS